MTASVACGWAGAVMWGAGAVMRNCLQNDKKGNTELTEQPTDQPTDGPTDGPTDQLMDRCSNC